MAANNGCPYARDVKLNFLDESTDITTGFRRTEEKLFCQQIDEVRAAPYQSPYIIEELGAKTA